MTECDGCMCHAHAVSYADAKRERDEARNRVRDLERVLDAVRHERASEGRAAVAEVERLTRERDEARRQAAEYQAERDDARALLVEVATIGWVSHGEDNDCRGDDWPKVPGADVPCEGDCTVDRRNAVIDRVCAAVDGWASTSSTVGGEATP